MVQNKKCIYNNKNNDILQMNFSYNGIVFINMQKIEFRF